MVFGLKSFAEKQLEQKGRDYDCVQAERNRAQRACEQMGARITTLERAFRHIHVRSDNGDACKQCGLDLRDSVHQRTE